MRQYGSDGSDGSETDVVVTLRDVGGSVPVALRLRRLLKVALRVFGLRCVDVRVADESHGVPFGGPMATPVQRLVTEAPAPGATTAALFLARRLSRAETSARRPGEEPAAGFER